MGRIIFALVAVSAFAQTVIAQQPRAAIGGTVNVVTQTHSNDQPLGGTSLGGSALFGVRVSPRVGIEFEPSFGASYSWQYTYRPFPSATAIVVAARRDTFFPVQARIRMRVLEPVVGWPSRTARSNGMPQWPTPPTLMTAVRITSLRLSADWMLPSGWRRMSISSQRFEC
jgi:hypothetical protein